MRCDLPRVVGSCAAFLLVLSSIPGTGCDAGVSLELLVGAPVNAGTSLEIRQRGHPRIRLDARFRSEPLDAPIYWTLRVAMTGTASGWCVELMHDKVHLDTSHPDVQAFSISHGLNFVTVQRRWIRRALELHAGAGILVAHPENTIRFHELDPDSGVWGTGYHPTGPAALLSAAYRISLGADLSALAELRASIARVRVPVDRGDARFVHVAGHLLVGVAAVVF